jgi:hypothetical protein
MPAIAQLSPDAKVIACVRELPWVIDSIERLIQRNVFGPSSIFQLQRRWHDVCWRDSQRIPRDCRSFE